jgi:hypothetical protein
MDEGLAAGNGYDGDAAFIDGVHALIVTQALVQDFIRVIDLAATGTGQVAAEERFEHEYQGIAFHSPYLLPEYIFGDAILLD